ncbi:MAG: sugar ABC transporter permease [Bacillota bacterium]|nr:sugar ABC transporter permease [Bacillota bacterium]
MAVAPVRRRRRTVAQQEALLAAALIAPSVIVIGLVVVYPVLSSIRMGFSDIPLDPRAPAAFVGFAHYAEILTDSEFWHALVRSLAFTAATVAGSTLLGLAVAILLNRPFLGRGIARGIVLMPYVAPVISLVFAWQYMFHPVYGFVNHWLVDVIPVFAGPRDWVESPAFAMPMVIIFDIWRYFPYAFLMILAKLQSIPGTLYEAAEVDGAGAWAKFRYVTLPELGFVIGAVVVLRWIWNFNKFDEIWLLSRNVVTVTVYTYLRAFQTFNLGQAAAASGILVVGLVVFVSIYVKKVLRW